MTTNNSINSANPVDPAHGGTGLSSITAHGIVVGEGTGSVTAKTLTNGQLLIGSTGADPVAANLTAGSNITITNGAGSISIAASGGGSTAWTLITSQTLSSTASPVTFTSASITSYNHIIFTFVNMQFSVNTGISVGGSTNGGTTYGVTGNLFTIVGGSSTTNAFNSGAPVLFYGSGSFVGSTNTNGWLKIDNTNVTDNKPILGMLSQGSAGESFFVHGFFQNTAQMNAFEFVLNSGSFSSGTINMYGM